MHRQWIVCLLTFCVSCGILYGQEQDKAWKRTKIIFAVTTAADLTTTLTLPQHLKEGNPALGRSKPQQVIVSAGSAAVAWLLARWLHNNTGPRKTFYRKAAHVVLLFTSGEHSGLAAHNIVSSYRPRR